MVQSKVGYLFGFTIFFFFLIQIGALAGVEILGGAAAGFTSPAPPTDPITTLLYVINNIGIFFTLMGASSEFFLLGTILIPAMTITLFWAILELIRGV